MSPEVLAALFQTLRQPTLKKASDPVMYMSRGDRNSKPLTALLPSSLLTVQAAACGKSNTGFNFLMLSLQLNGSKRFKADTPCKEP